MHSEYPNQVASANCKQFDLREGKYSYKTSYDTFKDQMGTKMEYSGAESKVPIQVTEQTKSVNAVPLRSMQLNFQSGEPMHLGMGLVSHLNGEVLKMLRNLSSDGNWAKSMKATYTASAEQILQLEKCDAYLNAKRAHSKLVAQRRKCAKQLELAINANASAAEVEELESKLRNLIESIAFNSESGGLGLMNRRIRGAKEFIRLTSSTDSIAKLIQLDQAEFLFRRSIQLSAGSFNKQHGNMELTARRGMMAMERRDEIFDATIAAFLDNPVLNGKVQDIMNWWKRAATILFELGKLMESQRKITPERLSELKKFIVDFGVLWRDKIGAIKNPVFWKLHALECCLVNFAETTGMTGRASAQGFENKHFLIGKLREMLDTIVQTEARVNKMSQRQQVLFLTGISKRVRIIEDNTNRTGPRGAYATRGKFTSQKENAVEPNEIDDDDVENAPAGFFPVENGGLLPNSFLEAYNYFKKSQVPEEWLKIFNEDEELGTKTKLEVKFYKT